MRNPTYAQVLTRRFCVLSAVFVIVACASWPRTAAGEDAFPLAVEFYPDPRTPRHNRKPTQLQTTTVLIPEKTDTKFTVGTRYTAYTDATFRFTDPKGKLLKQGTIKRPKRDSYRFVIEQPADGVTGTYKLEVRCWKPAQFWHSTMCSLGTQRFALPPKADPYGVSIAYRGRWYFRVPEQCEAFRIKVADMADSRVRTVVEAVAPNDKPYRSVSLRYGSPPKWLEVEPPRKWRGKIWSLAMAYGVILDVEGIPRWFAATPEGATP